MDGIFFWIATAFSAVVGLFGIRVDETPAYERLAADGAFEVRRYGPRLVAETRDTGDARAAADASFRRLAGYIFGANRGDTKIAMTAPVVMEKPGERIAMTAPVAMDYQDGEYVMRFFLPSRLTLATAPVPLDPRVRLYEDAGGTYAAVRFTGTSSPKRAAECEAALRDWMRKRGLQANGGAQVANYDPPFAIPFLRRNEVLVRLAGPGPSSIPRSMP